MKFRDNTPLRRTNQRKYTNYRAYKPSLKVDFCSRCGYCDDSDRFSDVPFHIDHFVPRDILKTIAENDYSNLVYACSRCNRAKWNKWPTCDENIHNNGKEGFIDPCNPEYDQQFERNERGEIIPTSQLGDWMWKELDLGNAAHRIIWTRTQIRKEIDAILQDPQVSKDERFYSFCKQYFFIDNQLFGTPHY